MHWLRSTWGTRIAVTVMVMSVLPALVAPVLQAGVPTPASATYDEWFRAQLPETPDAALEAALDAASRTRARSFEAFFRAFREAYQAQRPGSSLADALAPDAEVSDAGLLLYLRSRFLRLVGDAVLPRLAFTTALPSSDKTPTRASLLAISLRSWQAAEAPARLHAAPARPPALLPVRVLSAARPHGP